MDSPQARAVKKDGFILLVPGSDPVICGLSRNLHSLHQLSTACPPVVSLCQRQSLTGSYLHLVFQFKLKIHVQFVPNYKRHFYYSPDLFVDISCTNIKGYSRNEQPQTSSKKTVT